MPNKEEKSLEKSLNWTIKHLDYIFDNDNVPNKIRGLVRPNIESNGITLMSHSSSGHAVCSYLVKTCGLIKSN